MLVNSRRDIVTNMGYAGNASSFKKDISSAFKPKIVAGSTFVPSISIKVPKPAYKEITSNGYGLKKPAPTLSPEVKKAVDETKAIVQKQTESTSPTSTPATSSGGGSASSATDTVPPIPDDLTTPASITDKLTNFWAGLSTPKKGAVVVGAIVLAYFVYKHFYKGGRSVGDSKS